MIRLTECFSTEEKIEPAWTISLTAEERKRSRQKLELTPNQYIYIYLPRGTVLHDGNLLRSETGELIVRVLAKPEPVMTIRGKTTLDLIKAAYHLGNRHVALEITSDYLRISPDSVLSSLLIQLGLEVIEEIAPFQPEIGAYGHIHNYE
ncbi:Urease accessory protein ureE [Stanieria cyanosphaera PCC 7437]|uniref:Urease accessory protein UreE n=1 Tax=Stanieria cyanosphaera (strain ATCC 29371 / PCC 7437) TaxID=111780 RepID=K9XZB7_STAC7|nr:urease accessory protein UreE [Stanieria cyanosphaera]AFZ37466.1 Urease accessory protein ureE [Stanieria cyanosphaera PCC 7437]